MATEAGFNGAGPETKIWVLTDLDTGAGIVGQFIPQNVTKTIGGVIAEASSVNRQHPTIQWIQGVLDVTTFTARFWARDATDTSVEDRYQAMVALVERNKDLKRPPICNFAFAGMKSLSVDCLVESIGGVTFDEPFYSNPLQSSNSRAVQGSAGRMRGVTFQVTLKRYTPIVFTATDPTVPDSETRQRRAKKGDTYESIAADEYGDAELGVLLRQYNPKLPGMDVADLRPKDPVHIFSQEFLLTKEFQPEFHLFKTGDDHLAAEERLRSLFDARSSDAFVTTFSDTSPDEFL